MCEPHYAEEDGGECHTSEVDVRDKPETQVVRVSPQRTQVR